MTPLQVSLKEGTPTARTVVYTVVGYVSHKDQVVAVLNDANGTLTFGNIATLITLPHSEE